MVGEKSLSEKNNTVWKNITREYQTGVKSDNQ